MLLGLQGVAADFRIMFSTLNELTSLGFNSVYSVVRNLKMLTVPPREHMSAIITMSAKQQLFTRLL